MRQLAWLVVIALIGAIGYSLWRLRARWLERQRAAGQRFESFLAQAMPAANPAPQIEAAREPQEKLLLEAAAKAGEAGEPALAIQLYARLLSRYPASSFAGQARVAVEAQKRKLAKS